MLNLLERSANFAGLCSFTSKSRDSFVSGVEDSFSAYLIAALFNALQKSFLVILPEERSAELFYQDILNFLKQDKVFFLPSPELFTREEEIVSDIMFERVKTLTGLSLAKENYLLISQPAALAKKIPALAKCGKSLMDIRTGQNMRRDALIEYLVNCGYGEAAIVEEPGYFARRGGIIDVFPVDAGFPARIEFVGNRINSLRKFQAGTQLSFEKTGELRLLPVNEYYIGPETKNLQDELQDAYPFFIEPRQAFKSPLIKELILKNLIDPGWLKNLADTSVILQKNVSGDAAGRKLWHFNIFPAASRFKISPSFIWNAQKGEKLFIFSDNRGQEARVQKLLQEKGVDTGEIAFLQGAVSSGFSFPEIQLTVLSNGELFSRYKTRHASLRKSIEHIPLGSYAEIKESDYVVHYNEGIGIFEGMKKLRIKEEEEEFIVIRYEEENRLYVPVRNIHLVHKYIGSENPKISRLRGKNWLKARDKVKNAISDLASDLYRLYMLRQKEEGFVFSRDEEIQKQFDESFIYEETPDQAKAISEVKSDMSSKKMMDRIVCGDAGYGKTEIAIRASFKAVLSGKQVAILVPTTVLALQHFLSFKERFADFPVRIEMLSRLAGQNLQKETIENIKNGSSDIIIGTHRLLQKDVHFKDLGLLIVDEEQRFGVTHKERIKTAFKNIDALTLTATPIPRTLYMTLSGMKDISVIETPPQGRISVATYVGRYSEKLVKEAILKEIERKGQVFYLHNFIYDIEKVKNRLKAIVPFAAIEAAHGRMNPDKLADIMKRFSAGEIDILVATTIVENGIDIPRANTLIVDNAHRYGLADLYQLRGRVGRYKWRAYAYFLIPHHVFMTSTAKERLKALQELNKPGSGYRVALKDLEIRGAGNILGKEQHGFIEQVGFNLYCRFWQEAAGSPKTADSLPLSATSAVDIPVEYIREPSLRFYAYKKLFSTQTARQAQLLREELEDRFGPPPPEIDSFLQKRLSD